MTPLQAIQSATVTAAEVLGLGYDIGQITEGFAADFVVVRGNPLEISSYLRAQRMSSKPENWFVRCC